MTGEVKHLLVQRGILSSGFPSESLPYVSCPLLLPVVLFGLSLDDLR